MNRIIVAFALLGVLLAGAVGTGALAASAPVERGKTAQPSAVRKGADAHPAKRAATSSRKQDAEPSPTKSVPLPASSLSDPLCLDDMISRYCKTLNATSNPFLLRAPNFEEPDYERLLPEDMRVKFRIDLEKRIDPLTNRELPAPKFKINLSDPKETLKALSGSMEIRILDF